MASHVQVSTSSFSNRLSKGSTLPQLNPQPLGEGVAVEGETIVVEKDGKKPQLESRRWWSLFCVGLTLGWSVFLRCRHVELAFASSNNAAVVNLKVVFETQGRTMIMLREAGQPSRAFLSCTRAHT
jgi:hypothetical protein